MIKFSKDKILLLHKILAEATGGSSGVRDDLNARHLSLKGGCGIGG